MTKDENVDTVLEGIVNLLKKKERKKEKRRKRQKKRSRNECECKSDENNNIAGQITE